MEVTSVSVITSVTRAEPDVVRKVVSRTFVPSM